MKEEYTIQRGGKTLVLYRGLLDECHSKGLRAIRTTVLQIPCLGNGNVAVVHAEVELEHGTFAGIGDASPGNVSEAMIPHLLRLAECVPVRAQALTPFGWKHHDELRLWEIVAAYDADSDTIRWTPLLDVQVFENEPTVRLHGKSFDVTCTPNHRWVTKRGIIPLDQFVGSESIRVAAPATGGTLLIDPREAAILGWLATDGTVREYMVGECGPYTSALIRQSKPQYVEELATLTAGVASHRVEAGRQRDFGSYVSDCLPQHTFGLATQFFRALFDRIGFERWSDLPGIVCNLPREARAAMLDAMLKGDGTQNAYGGWVFGKKRKPGVMEAFEILATLEGIALGSLQMSSAGDVPLRTLRRNRHVSVPYLKREDAGTQTVWCPTTRFGTWVMRLDNTICITGNTRSKVRAMRDATNVAMLSTVDIDEEEDAGSGAPAAEQRTPPTKKQRNYLHGLMREHGFARDGVDDLDAATVSIWINAVKKNGVSAQLVFPPWHPMAGAMPEIDWSQVEDDQAEEETVAIPPHGKHGPTEEQIAAITKLASLLGVPATIADDMTSADAGALILELSGKWNQRRKSSRSS